MRKASSFRVWKTILLGTHGSVEELKASILDKGFRIGDWANDVLKSSAFTLAKEVQKVHLVKVTPAELGFPYGAYRPALYERAVEYGLKMCPLEIGPQLRLQYPSQPRLESLQIGMVPQKDSEDHESEFRVVHGGDNFLWLVGDHKHPDDLWSKNEPFIFIQ